MSHKSIFFVLLMFPIGFTFGQTIIKDKQTQYPVSYATISFGNGFGLFADDEGKFVFTKKSYPDVDSLFVSALGYKTLPVATSNLPSILFMETQIDELNEVIIRTKIDRKFKEEVLKPYLDDDYYHCWLPTIESEIAVFFPNENDQDKKIATVHFPITLESKNWEKRKKKNSEKQRFSTLFKVKFYHNNQGFPGKELIYENIVFRATEKGGDVYNLDVSRYDILVPDNGFFVSLQVLGYTDDEGKLLPNKKYKEIKTGGDIVKIPTNFRPLLPFTDEIPENRTYVKRVFVNDNEWSRFEKGSDVQSGLLKAGLNNYGIGLTFNVYQDK
ncbi:MAG TPA: hypothetical protein VKZ98_04550 [Aquaticitalea sp.]|nr:hypothetical protein [Aquaticitalea sp.]